VFIDKEVKLLKPGKKRAKEDDFKNWRKISAN
jgi:hypothetical protein